MKRSLLWLRYSGVGVFCAGLIAVIQGCSPEREGALFAVLLLMLNFCSGPAADPMPEPFFVGNEAIDRAVTIIGGAGRSYLDQVQPATGNGTVTTVKIALDPSTGFGDITVFIARLNAGTVYDIIDTEVVSLSAATCPDQGTFYLCRFPVDLSGVQQGDFIGHHRSSSPRIELDISTSGDAIFCTACVPIAGSTLNFGSASSETFSLQGSGLTNP